MCANKNIGMFGIFHEAWQMCCSIHNIDWSEKEEERYSEAVEKSYYHPDKIREREERREENE